jgi:hypothetical protein
MSRQLTNEEYDMKKNALFLLMAVSCQMLQPQSETGQKGELRIAFYDDLQTRSELVLPDTSDFLLTVTGPGGEIIYDGAYGDSPESIMVDAGSYTVNVRSCEFNKPSFSTPQFGDEQCVVVPSGGVADVKLVCVQRNAGVRLKIDESFIKECPDASLFLKSQEGKLMYGYSEKRVAYFSPGSVSLMMSENASDKILMTRNLQPQTVLTLNVSAASTSSDAEERIRVAVDTSRTWLTEDYVIGGGSDKGGGASDALTVSQALASVGEEDVWVCGYIVGGDLTSSSASFESPFSSRTNILLGPRSSTTTKSSCLSVSLPSGHIRDDLNLVDNPSLLGCKVSIRGNIVEAYYGIPGMKNLTDFELH